MSNQKTIQLPTTTNELRQMLKTAIEFYHESPAKNENKLNEALAASLSLANYDTLSALLKEEAKEAEKTKWLYDIERNMGFSTINDIKIHENVFDNVDTAFCIVDREDRISELYRWIGDCSNSVSREYMVEKWKGLVSYLERSNEEYVLEAIEYSEFIAFDLEPKEFNEACEEILEANEKYKTENHKLAEKLNDGKIEAVVLDENEKAPVSLIKLEMYEGMPLTLDIHFERKNGERYLFMWDIQGGSFEEKEKGQYLLKIDFNYEDSEDLLIQIL